MKFVWLYREAKTIEVSPQSTLSCTAEQLAEFHEGEVGSTWDGNHYNKSMRSDAGYKIGMWWSNYG